MECKTSNSVPRLHFQLSWEEEYYESWMCTAQATTSLYRIPESENKNPIRCQYTSLAGCPCRRPSLFDCIIPRPAPYQLPHLLLLLLLNDLNCSSGKVVTNAHQIDSKMTSSETGH
jgi:hypothetical protein